MRSSVATGLQKAFAVGCLTLALSFAFSSLPNADQFQPLCAELEAGDRDCWNPIEVTDHEGCHFFGHVSYFDHAPPMTWSGSCRGGRAQGDGFLQDRQGNRAEGRLVEGLKDGRWTVILADGGTVTESYAEGFHHGPWTFDLSDGRFYAMSYEDGRLAGPWERRDDDGYREVGTARDGKFEGALTITWPNGVEAVVTYVNGRIEGRTTVTHAPGRHMCAGFRRRLGRSLNRLSGLLRQLSDSRPQWCRSCQVRRSTRPGCRSPTVRGSAPRRGHSSSRPIPPLVPGDRSPSGSKAQPHRTQQPRIQGLNIRTTATAARSCSMRGTSSQPRP